MQQLSPKTHAVKHLASEVAAGSLSPEAFIDEYYDLTIKTGVSRSLSPKKYKDFLQILEKKQGFITDACRMAKIHPHTVKQVIQQDPQFSAAVLAIQEYYDDKNLDTLERVSLVRAKKPENYQERKFQLQRLAPERYRDRKDISPPNIQINFGYSMPEDRYGMDADGVDKQAELPGDAEIEASFDCVKAKQ
jgi:hypothetical protein|tara:strand:+ start:2283 stop:2855 length:573 start_codon:yes stop_codon:yes gene_type:complete